MLVLCNFFSSMFYPPLSLREISDVNSFKLLTGLILISEKRRKNANGGKMEKMHRVRRQRILWDRCDDRLRNPMLYLHH